MTAYPTLTPAEALARLAGGSFSQEGFAYEMDAEFNHGPDTVPFAREIATDTLFCATGEAGTPISADDKWMEV